MADETPKPTETRRPKLLDVMTAMEGELDLEEPRRPCPPGDINAGLKALLRSGAPKPKPEPEPEPKPTLDDLLAACDLAEEGGAPPAVVAALRATVRDGLKIQRHIPSLRAVFGPEGICHHMIREVGDLIADGIPVLCVVATRLQRENNGLRQSGADPPIFAALPYRPMTSAEREEYYRGRDDRDADLNDLARVGLPRIPLPGERQVTPRDRELMRHHYPPRGDAVTPP